MNAEYQAALRYINSAGTNFYREVIQLFLEAMREGYASDAKPKEISGFPGSKGIEYRKGEWRVLDIYFVGPNSPQSGGTTYIWYGPILVWMMSYHGWYAKEAVPFLKTALARNYCNDKFYGGRGPRHFNDGVYAYTNEVNECGLPQFLSGQESIVALRDTRQVGFHRYQAVYLPDAT